jgi:NitT/TauT family transport system permease protein
MNKVIRQVSFYTILLGSWQAIAMLKIWPVYLFPTPATVYQAMRAGFADHSFWIAIGVSMKRVVAGYAVSCVAGIALGFWITYSKLAAETVGQLLMSLQSLPSLCWMPMAILWFGLTEKAIIFVVIMGSVLSIAIAIESGLRNTPNIYRMAGRNLGACGYKLILYVLLPASMPHLVSGLKQGWAFAWRALINGEMIFVTLGLGQILMMGRDLNDVSQIFAAMLLIIAIGWLVDVVCFSPWERTLRKRWGLLSN